MRDQDGYGRIGWHGRIVRAHRLAYQLVHGPIPDGLLVCHSCDVPSCVNPAHLWVGTDLENKDDSKRKGRRPQGPTHRSVTHPHTVPRGERHWKAKLTPNQVEMIRLLVLAGARARTIARDYGIGTHHVYALAAGRAWRHS